MLALNAYFRVLEVPLYDAIFIYSAMHITVFSDSPKRFLLHTMHKTRRASAGLAISKHSNCYL